MKDCLSLKAMDFGVVAALLTVILIVKSPATNASELYLEQFFNFCTVMTVLFICSLCAYFAFRIFPSITERVHKFFVGLIPTALMSGAIVLICALGLTGAIIGTKSREAVVIMLSVSVSGAVITAITVFLVNLSRVFFAKEPFRFFL